LGAKKKKSGLLVKEGRGPQNLRPKTAKNAPQAKKARRNSGRRKRRPGVTKRSSSRKDEGPMTGKTNQTELQELGKNKRDGEEATMQTKKAVQKKARKATGKKKKSYLRKEKKPGEKYKNSGKV